MDEAFTHLNEKELNEAAERRGLDNAAITPEARPGGGYDAPLPAATRQRRPRAGHDLKPDGPAPTPGDIPWGYGETRIVALARDPYWLCVYWEVTDEAIATARDKLGPGGPDAVCVLRVYDTTYRLFDGTNASSYFDVHVDRAWNNYFLKVSRPRATFHVEVGMKSHEGYFAHIARSTAAEMPADSMAGDSEVQWMTVRPARNGARPSSYTHRYTPRPGETRPSQAAAPGANGAAASVRIGDDIEVIHRSRETRIERVISFLLGGETFEGHWLERVLDGEWVRWVRWQGGEQRFWRSEPQRITWEHVGPVQIWMEGQRRLTQMKAEGAGAEVGPWHVVITGRGFRGERRILNTWMVRMGWGRGGLIGAVNTPAIYRRFLGVSGSRELFAAGSELRLRERAGASEELFAAASLGQWLGASEQLLRGASEILQVGASELLQRGASEVQWQLGGASEVVLGGASLFAIAGASEQWLAGASEVTFAGASLFVGGSEVGFGGASKAAFGGASELAFPGGSEVVVGLSSGESWHGFAAAPTAAGPQGRVVGPPAATPSSSEAEHREP